MVELPHDSDGDAIRRVISGGSDLSRPMDIDYHISASSAQVAERVAAEARKLGFKAEVVKDESGTFTASCSRTMILSYQGVIDLQSSLSEMCIPLGAYSDGWGTFGNKP